MIEIAANVHLSNKISIHGVGYELHLKTPIASYNLSPPHLTYQQYHIILKSTNDVVPAILHDSFSQIFLFGGLIICPLSNEPTIIVERSKWQVHRGEFADVHHYENAQLFGRACVEKVHRHPFRERITHVEVSEIKKRKVCCGTLSK
jgi:hypothetical protein